MTEHQFNEFLFHATAMSEFMAGIVVGMCLVALPIVMFWPRKAGVGVEAESGTELVANITAAPVSPQVSDGRADDADADAGFLPAMPHPSA